MDTGRARTVKFDLQLALAEKEALQAAAAVSRRSVSEFVLESALARANEVLADRREFRLSTKRWGLFLKALDAPPRRLPRMSRLLKERDFFGGAS